MTGVYSSLKCLRAISLFVGVLGLCVTASQPAQAQTYDVLYTFCSQPNCADGAVPVAGLVLDAKGNLYGTTSVGGSDQYGTCCLSGGTVFEVTSSGTEKVLYNFCSQPNCADGSVPSAGLIFDKSANAFKGGNLYGTTAYAGVNGGGTVFELSPTGTEKVLYSFCSQPNCADGEGPYAGLVRDAQGNLYGTTYWGGGPNLGTVFELTPAGIETPLYAFTDDAGDANPSGGLVRDAQGNLYGTTQPFNFDGPLVPGTVFELTSAGAYKTLYAFCSKHNCGDGSAPFAGLVQDARGNLYGTTGAGGNQSCYSGCGVVFKVTPSGKEKVLYAFCAQPNCADGAVPVAGLVLDTKGNLYGTSTGGGAFGYGTVFELSPTGTEKVLYSFTGGADGGSPQAGLVRDGSGNLYGTTAGGGNNVVCGGVGGFGCGVVFKIKP
ncbi:MAG: choice-of-anchor tandem repeat GloVer-containing protein [Terriglobales bacterium]